METAMSGRPDGELYEQTLREIREAYGRQHPRPTVAPDMAKMLERIAEDCAATLFGVAWRLAPYLKDQLEYARGHLDPHGQEKFDSEDVLGRSLMHIFASSGITEETAWRIVDRHFGK